MTTIVAYAEDCENSRVGSRAAPDAFTVATFVPPQADIGQLDSQGLSRVLAIYEDYGAIRVKQSSENRAILSEIPEDDELGKI